MTVLKNWPSFFKASRSLCFDAGRGCLVIANLLGMPEFHRPCPIERTDGWEVDEGKCWFDDFFFPGKTDYFHLSSKVFLRSFGHELWRKKSKQKDDWRSSCPDSESFRFAHQQFVVISHMNGFPFFHEETKLVSSWFDIPFSTEAWFHQREGTVGIFDSSSCTFNLG